VPVTFTSGDRRTEKWDGSFLRVSLGKSFMVSRLQAMLGTGRLHLPKTREAEALTEELLDYELRVDADGQPRAGADRVGTHDDLVTAVGLAVQVNDGKPRGTLANTPGGGGDACIVEDLGVDTGATPCYRPQSIENRSDVALPHRCSRECRSSQLDARGSQGGSCRIFRTIVSFAEGFAQDRGSAAQCHWHNCCGPVRRLALGRRSTAAATSAGDAVRSLTMDRAEHQLVLWQSWDGSSRKPNRHADRRAHVAPLLRARLCSTPSSGHSVHLWTPRAFPRFASRRLL
jgi:hypothetical protein